MSDSVLTKLLQADPRGDCAYRPRRGATSLPPAPAGLPYHVLPSFLLRAAVHARWRVNLAGLVARTGCAAVIAMVLAGGHVPALGWFLLIPLWVGLVLAGLDLATAGVERLTQARSGRLRRFGEYLVRTRAAAALTTAGAFEIVLGPACALVLLILPSSGELTAHQRVVGVAALMVYVAVGTHQVVTDAGYYNHLEGRHPARWLWWARGGLPALMAAVTTGSLVAAPDDRVSLGAAVALGAVPVLAYIPMVLFDRLYASALYAHVQSLEQAVRLLQRGTSSDVHGLKSMIEARSVMLDALGAARVLEDIGLEVEAMRIRQTTGFAFLRVQEVFDCCEQVLRERAQAARFVADQEVRTMFVDPPTMNLLRRVVLDLVDNAAKSCTPPPSVSVELTVLATTAVSRRYQVRIVDDGPGFDVPQMFPERSSTMQLQLQCDAHGGGLTIDSGPGGTSATATFKGRNQSGGTLGASTHDQKDPAR